MDNTATTANSGEVGRHVGDMAGRPRQSVYDDVVRQAIEVLSARAEHAIKVPVMPVGGPEYTGRA